MHEASFDEAVDQICQKDTRYHREAYHFIREALSHTKKNKSKRCDDPVLHVTGQELLEGVREFALKQFGPMTLAIFEEWGITKCADFGDIVFNLINASVLAKTDKDRRADFEGGYDFAEAFHKPFLPAARQSEFDAARQPPDDKSQRAPLT